MMAIPDPNYTELVTAFRAGQWTQVVQGAGPVLARMPDHVGLLHMTGVAHLELRQPTHAVALLERAMALAPDQPGIAVCLARALASVRRLGDAKAVADHASRLPADDPAIPAALGLVYSEANAHHAAAAAFRRTLALAPHQSDTRYNLATALVALGEADAAERELEACLAVDPGHGRSHLMLAHLRQQTPEDNHLPRLRACLGGHPSRDARICLNLALAKEHEDLGHYAEAFDHLVRGKSASRAGLDYAIEQDERIFAAMARATPSTPTTTEGHDSEEPIFVMGMPRTGTTLVERILSSHPDVFAAGELQNFGMAVRQSWRGPAPIWRDSDIAATSRGLDWSQVGTRYIASTRPATGHTARFVDKFPFNFLYAGFIARALPKARLICLRRHPLDTCLSNFRQLFGEKLPYYHYSFDLLDTGRYYVLFHRLMEHWRQVLPGRILELSYESLVDAGEATTRQLVAFCGLPWNEACLHFEQNPASVGTASALQVRSPVYTHALERWKNYTPYLSELRRLLVQADIPLA
jgi:tetratricopeptide (TPR) repeat protein